MSKSFQVVRLGDVLIPVSRSETVVPEKTYHILGAHWYAKGLYTKDIKSGSQIQAKTLYRAEQGDFVYNRLFAWKGSFAIASEKNHGCYVSNEFPCFLVNQDRIDGRYLWRYFSRAGIWEEAFGLSTGGTPTSRNRLKEDKLLAMKMPLPPVEEQRRIVAKIDELAAKIEDARKLRQQALEESEALTYATSQELFGKPDKAVGDIADVTKLAGFEYTEYFSQAVPGNVIVVRAGNVRNKGLDLSNAMTITEEVSDALPRSQLKPGDVLMTFIGAKIGDVTYVRPNHPRLHCGPNVAKLTPHKCISTLYFVKVLQSSLIQRQIEEITKSTAQPSLSMKTIRQLKLPVPPLSEQEQIVAYTDKLQATVDPLKQFQKQTAAELDTLMPSILDKAFKGEL